MKNQNLLIFGAGGHGRVVEEVARGMNLYKQIDFLDDNSSVAIGTLNDYIKTLNVYNNAFVALGDNRLRSIWISKLIDAGYKLPYLVHPDAYVSPSATIEEGVVILPKAVINTNVRIGKGTIIGIGSLIDHDATVGEYCHINSGAIIRPNEMVDSFTKVDAGKVYSKVKMNEEYSFEIGV